MAKAKKKPAKKNQKGLDRLQRTVEKLREEYEAKYPFAVDYDDVQTPEGLPTFEEFVNSKSAGRAYNEADPLWEYQKTSQLGPLAFQRWRGAQTSKDGKNYRTPYIALPSIVSTGMGAAVGAKGGAGVAADGKMTLGPEGLTGGFGKYKEGHRRYMEQRSILDKIKGIPGSIAPPANYLTGRGASIGGRHIPKIAGAIPSAMLTKEILKDDGQSKIPLMFPWGAATAGAFANMPTQLVVPTAGFKLNPFGKTARGLKKESRKSNKELDKRLERGTRYYDQQAEKEKANLEREASLYEKKYGTRPILPEQTMNYKPAPYIPGEGRRTENRNPVYLKDGGKVKVVKYKKK